MKRWVLRGATGLAVMLALMVAILLLMGNREDAGVSRVSLEIAGSPEQLWGWLDDGDKFKQWVGWVTEVKTLNPEARGVGRKSITTMKEPGSTELVRIESVLTAYDPPRSYSADVVMPGVFTGSQTYRLVEAGSGRTRVEVESHIQYTMWIVRLLEPLATPSATAKLEQDLAALKAAVEKADR